MTYLCPAWELAADTHLIRLQLLQDRVLHTIGKFARNTSIRDMHIAFQILYMYSYITKLCSQQAQVVQNHENACIGNIGQSKA
jgi:hypothetical protein